MSTWLIPGVDSETKLFPQPTMDALSGALNTAGEPLLAQHIVAPEPHAAYDDIPSLTVLFENGLV